MIQYIFYTFTHTHAQSRKRDLFYFHHLFLAKFIQKFVLTLLFFRQYYGAQTLTHTNCYWHRLKVRCLPIVDRVLYTNFLDWWERIGKRNPGHSTRTHTYVSHVCSLLKLNIVFCTS